MGRNEKRANCGFFTPSVIITHGACAHSLGQKPVSISGSRRGVSTYAQRACHAHMRIRRMIQNDLVTTSRGARATVLRANNQAREQKADILPRSRFRPPAQIWAPAPPRRSHPHFFFRSAVRVFCLARGERQRILAKLEPCDPRRVVYLLCPTVLLSVLSLRQRVSAWVLVMDDMMMMDG